MSREQRREPAVWRRLLGGLRSDFIAGILVVMPLAITVLVGIWVTSTIDGLLDVLPDAVHPERIFRRELPGLGIAVTLAVIVLAGAASRYVTGRKVVSWYEAVLLRVPILRVVYQGFRQLLGTLLENQATSFRQVVLVEYPRRDAWALAFLTGAADFLATHAEHGRLHDEALVSVFLPTTPNPTSGFYLVMPTTDVLLVDLSVEEAFKLIMSAGIVNPEALRGVTRLSELSDLPDVSPS